MCSNLQSSSAIAEGDCNDFNSTSTTSSNNCTVVFQYTSILLWLVIGCMLIVLLVVVVFIVLCCTMHYMKIDVNELRNLLRSMLEINDLHGLSPFFSSFSSPSPPSSSSLNNK